MILPNEKYEDDHPKDDKIKQQILESQTIINNLQSFWDKVELTPDCWLWTGAKNTTGYAQFWDGDKTISAHRFAYNIFNEPIDLPLDHLCRVRHCVNPAHLEPVTNKENILRGIGITAVNSRKTHCKNGHGLSGDNLYVHNNQRKCKECRREAWRKWKNAQ